MKYRIPRSSTHALILTNAILPDIFYHRTHEKLTVSAKFAHFLIIRRSVYHNQPHCSPGGEGNLAKCGTVGNEPK